MKKRYIGLVLIMLGWISISVYAGDPMYRMLYGDEVASLRGDQDAVVILELIEASEKSFTAVVRHTLSGSVEDEIIELNKEGLWLLGFGPRDNSTYELQPGDACVISIKKVGDVYKQAWYAVKTDTYDWQTLSCQYLHHNTNIDILQWYIRSDGSQKDYYVEDYRAYARSMGGSVEITLPLVGNFDPFDLSEGVSEEELIIEEMPLAEGIFEEDNEAHFEQLEKLLSLGLVGSVLAIGLFLVKRK